MIGEDIKNFPKQFTLPLASANLDKIKPFESIVVGGMGGSGLIAGVLRAVEPALNIIAHHDYGLPAYLMDSTGSPRENTDKFIFIAVSYSGNTEETLDFFEEAIKKNLNVAVMATGGRLLQRARETAVPFIVLPHVSTQPRLALGVMLQGILKLIEKDDLSAELAATSQALKPEGTEPKGKELAEKLHGKIPVIYSSRRNLPIAYNWKVDFNEGAKIPCFYNVLPELNHNEMQGFSAGGGSASGGDPNPEARKLTDKFHFIFIKDAEDHPRIAKRMEITKKLYDERGIPVSVVETEGNDRAGKVFNSLILAAWTAYYTAKIYKTDPEAVAMIEEFKKLL